MKRYHSKNKTSLFEKQEVTKKAPEKKLNFSSGFKSRNSKDSLDDKIDSLILMYEKNSIRDENDRIEESLFKSSLLALLVEQDEEDPAEEPVEDEGTEGVDDDGAADEEDEEETPEGSEKMKASIASDQKVPDLDIDMFTKNVVRLAGNYESLLNPEEVIYNRAKNFLDNNYGDAFVSRFLQELKSQYGVDSSSHNVPKRGPDAPFAVGANPSGAGGGG